jgi:hypothetical protein
MASLLLASAHQKITRILQANSGDLYAHFVRGQHYASGHLGAKTGGVAARACTKRPQKFFSSGDRASTGERSLQQSQRPLPQIKEHLRIIVLLSAVDLDTVLAEAGVARFDCRRSNFGNAS